MDYKFSIYEEAGVSEYWIVHPPDKIFYFLFCKTEFYRIKNPQPKEKLLVPEPFQN